jgi:multiple sugar transport system substrate-binding protein
MKKINNKALMALFGLSFLLFGSFFFMPMAMATPNTSQDVELTIAVTNQQAPGVRGVIDEFLASDLGDGVSDVSVVSTGETADDQLSYISTRMSAQDTELDVVGIDTVWTASFADNGWIVNLDSRLSSGEMDDYASGMVASGTYDGSVWAYPYFMNLGILYYRNDLLTKYGYTEADIGTWEDLKVVANDILEQENDDDLVGYLGQFDNYEGGTVNFMEWIGSNGVTDIFDSEENPDLTQTGVNEALTFLKGLIPPEGTTDLIDTDYIIPRDALTFNEGSSQEVWLAGNAIFIRQWTYIYGLSEDENLDFGVATLPVFEGATNAKSSAVGGALLSISEFSQNKDEAMNLIKFLGDKEAQTFELTNLSNFPALKSVYSDLPSGYEWVSEWEDQLDLTLARPVHPEYPSMSSEISNYFNQIISCDLTVTNGLETMQSRVEGAIAPAPAIPAYPLPLLLVAITAAIGLVAILTKKRY